MLDINKRFKELREYLNLNQKNFGSSIGLSTSGISNIESGTRNVTEKHILLINNAFNVNKNWLRTGEGEMFIQSDVFSLDEYAEKANLSELETDIIKAYINLDSDVRQDIMSSLKSMFDKHSEVAVAKDDENDIEKELESYRLELEAEKKGRMSEVSENTEKNIG